MEGDPTFKSLFPEEVYSVTPPVNVLIGTPWDELRDDHRQLLSKILQSVKLSLEKVRIIQQASPDLSVLKEKPGRIIAFVNPPRGLALYEVIETGEASVVFSDPLEKLNADDDAKRKLWNTLKILFSS